MMSPVLPYFPIKRITTKQPEYTKNMWQKGDIPDEVGQLVQSIKLLIVLCPKHICNYQDKYDRLHHPSVLKTSPVVPTFTPWFHHGHHGLRACDQQFLRIACTSILKKTEQISMRSFHASNWSPKSNYEQRHMDTDHLVWLTSKKNHSVAYLRKIFESTLMYLAEDCWLLSYTHAAIK